MDRREFLAAGAAASLSPAFGPRALAARLGGNAVAFVTADLESHVAVLELDTAQVLRRIRTSPGPRSIESVRQRIAVVAHTEHGVVTLIDAPAYRIRAELRFEAPRYAAVHPRHPIAYVTDSAAEAVVTLNAENGRFLTRTSVPGPARHIGISADGRTLWTSLGTAAARIAVLDAGNPRRPHLERTLAPPFLAHDVVFAPDGRTAWVTSGSERRIALYRGERRPARIVASGSSPQHVSFTSRKVFVACGDDGEVHRHRLDGERVREARVPTGSFNVTSLHGRVVTPSLGDGRVSILDRNGRVQSITKVARAAHDACIVVVP